MMTKPEPKGAPVLRIPRDYDQRVALAEAAAVRLEGRLTRLEALRWGWRR